MDIQYKILEGENLDETASLHQKLADNNLVNVQNFQSA